MRTAALLLVLLLAGCEREDRDARPPAPAAAKQGSVRMSDLQPGTAQPAPAGDPNGYEENAVAVSEGKRLFRFYNCSGCHAQGGGGMGPPLMDATWIYGSEPANVHATILEGRPNGMPSFRGKVADHQAWQLTAYVRSMSGLLGKAASPSRSDHMNARPAEQSAERQSPRPSGVPPSAEKP